MSSLMFLHTNNNVQYKVLWLDHLNVEARTVDVHIRRLRKALNAWDGTELVRTVRGAGYSLDVTSNTN